MEHSDFLNDEDLDAIRQAMQSNDSLREQLERQAHRHELLGSGDDWDEEEALQAIAAFEIAIEAERSDHPTELVNDLFRRAATAGHPEAMYRAAIIAIDEGNDTEYESWIVKGANVGQLDAMYLLGAELVRRGEGARGCVWLGKAANAGSVDACHDLGYFYLNNGRWDIAEHWLKLAAQNGCIPAINKLGVLELQQRDLKSAIAHWRVAAERGDPDAQTNLDNFS